jgi:hypothetical protein
LISQPAKTPCSKEHEVWLLEAARAVPTNRDIHVFILGYPSKLGFRGQDLQHSDALNVTLSTKRYLNVELLKNHQMRGAITT